MNLIELKTCKVYKGLAVRARNSGLDFILVAPNLKVLRKFYGKIMSTECSLIPHLCERVVVMSANTTPKRTAKP